MNLNATNPGVEPKTLAFLRALETQGGPPLYELPLAEARAVAASAQAIGVVKLPVDIEDRTIPGGPNGQIGIRILRPKGSAGGLPVVMYFHGGGWVLNDRNTHDRLLRELANGAGAAVVFVDYSRSPEATYPTGIEEAYTATRWLVEKAKALNLDASRLAVAGDSSGGNMAAVVALLAKERGGPKLRFQLLFFPTVDANFDTGSYRTYSDGYFLSREDMKWFWNSYLPDVPTRMKPTASPLQASLEQLRGLPPALVITAEHDVLRDEGEAYARKLMQAGVQVTATRYLGTIHAFVVLNALAETPAPRAAIAQANEALRTALGKNTPARSPAPIPSPPKP